jgi:hypothetical protein
MKKDEALNQFKENFVKEKVNEQLFELDDYYTNYKNDLASKFTESFQRLCAKVSTMQTDHGKGRIGFIHYSMLRTRLQEKNWESLIEVYNNRWYLDPLQCWQNIDSSWIWRFYNVLDQMLESERKQYMNLIGRHDIDQILLKEASKFHQYLLSLVRYAVPQALALPEWNDLAVGDELEIRVGEYFDYSEIAYKVSFQRRDSEEVRELLEGEDDSVYSFETMTGLNLSDGQYHGLNLGYADLSGSDLSRSNMTDAILVGAKFIGSYLDNANLSGAILHEANFSNASLKNANFSRTSGFAGLRGDETNWERPGFSPLQFTGADLTGTNFRGADLRGAIFAKACVEEVDFEDALLERAIFSKEDAERVRLEPEQRACINWT